VLFTGSDRELALRAVCNAIRSPLLASYWRHARQKVPNDPPIHFPARPVPTAQAQGGAGTGPSSGAVEQFGAGHNAVTDHSAGDWEGAVAQQGGGVPIAAPGPVTAEV